MVIDTSVLICILFDEPDRDIFQRVIEASQTRLVSAVSKLETSMVLIGRHGPSAGPEADLLLSKLAAVVVPLDEHQADLARDAFARFGKGRHRAGLNLGDCAAYALAISEGEPLLFKGTDFGATDVESML